MAKRARDAKKGPPRGVRRFVLWGPVVIHFIALRDPADGLLRSESISRFRAADGYVIRYAPSEGGYVLTHPSAPGVVRGVPLSNVVFWHADAPAPEPTVRGKR